MSSLHVLKGHGTQNDFVVVPDPDGSLDLGVELVRALCDRRAGIGGDGVLRIVRTEDLHDPAARAVGGDAEWFMDYRNADGSVAEMCGNGVRVVAAYLGRTGLAAGPAVVIGTRAGPLNVRYEQDGLITVDMGPAAVAAHDVTVGVVGQPDRDGRPVSMPNPHVVVEVPDEQILTALDLSGAPAVDPAGPAGQNVEFIARVGPGHLRMRVHERGVGETRSCGTGICAAVAALVPDADDWWQVDVPGGICFARTTAHGAMELRGPAVLVAELDVDTDALYEGKRLETPSA